ncbi:MAG: phytoene/squalene synthase family protein [Rhodoblastus sp.]|uniref:phytoene/squalene synthase family protein n=1 Tax=Rhodoblastus sp. TaxID=1962975 RepID=UPI003F98154C
MDRLAEHYALCGVALRDSDRDRWLACLFAPDAERPHLFALYAFNAEVSRIREHVSQPILGEMRLQWWIEALNGSPGGEVRGDLHAHPVADALLATIATLSLPRKTLVDLLEARRFDLYDDPAPDLHFLEAYCGETCSSLFRLASLILGGTGGKESAEAAGHAGCAYALTGLLRAFPWHVVHHQCYLPRDILERHNLEPRNLFAREDGPALRAALAEMRALARDHLGRAAQAVAALQRQERLAYLPLALLELYLREMERKDYDPYKTLVEVAQWRRQWALWRAKI